MVCFASRESRFRVRDPLTAFPDSGATLALGDAIVLVDGAPIYTLKGARAGLFRALTYADYPAVSARAHGGRHA